MAEAALPCIFLPLGGSGEIGMNLNLFGYGTEPERQWMIVDIGVSFADASLPGIDVVMPDIGFIEARKEQLLGIVITHAHEDHMGALARLWSRLRCPVYASPFTMFLVKDRLAEAGLLEQVELHEIALGGRFHLGVFDIELLSVTHSIPEPNALIIRTPAGVIVHTGDWKLDPTPQIGQPVNEPVLKALGDAGVLAVICDSTNILSAGHSGSEASVRAELLCLIGEYKGKAIAVTTFASNVARLESLIKAAMAHHRQVCLIGRSMHRMVAAARSVGLLADMNMPLKPDQAALMPQEDVLYICTGSQGESRAALSQIAQGRHKFVQLGKGSVVIFSSKIIPGNEKAIFALHNHLSENDVDVITEKDRPIHVSGHPCQDEVKQFYDWIRPRVSIAVHGERRHLRAHMALARDCGIETALAGRNGQMIALSGTTAEVMGEIPHGRLYEDGTQIISAEDAAIKMRRKIAYGGHLALSMVIDENGCLIASPVVCLNGIAHAMAIENELVYKVENILRNLPKKQNRDKEALEVYVGGHIRRYMRQVTGKKVVVDILMHKVSYG